MTWKFKTTVKPFFLKKFDYKLSCCFLLNQHFGKKLFYMTILKNKKNGF